MWGALRAPPGVSPTGSWTHIPFIALPVVRSVIMLSFTPPGGTWLYTLLCVAMLAACGDDAGDGGPADGSAVDAATDSGADPTDAATDSGADPSDAATDSGADDADADPDGGELSVTITGPSATAEDEATLAFECAALVDCTFECAVDDGEPMSCTSPATIALPGEGEHVFRVFAAAAGGRAAEAEHLIVVDRVAPSLVEVRFVEYDLVRLVFDEPIGRAETADFSITQKPVGMAVRSVEIDGSTVDVRLTRLHLPWDGYELSFAVEDRLGNSTSVADRALTPALGARLAFASSQVFNGSIPLPVGVDCATDATGLGRADCVCQAEASAAGMVGTFRAALSAPGQGAFCRMRGLGGTESDNCERGAEEPLPPLGPWVRADGLAVSDAYDPTNPGVFFAQPGMRLDGAIPSVPIWTGSNDYLQSANTCSGWSVSEGTTGSHSTNQGLPFLFGGSSTCNNTLGLLCVQVGADALPTKPVLDVPEGARRTFISSTRLSGNITHESGAAGLDGADAICTSLAADAGLPGDDYVAILSGSSDDAICRVLGLTGKRDSDACGATADQLGSGPIVSVHGHHLADDVAELFTSGPREPYMATEDGAYRYTNIVWSGSTVEGVVANSVCADEWTSDIEWSLIGWPYRAQAQWINAGWANCTLKAHLICVQR